MNFSGSWAAAANVNDGFLYFISPRLRNNFGNLSSLLENDNRHVHKDELDYKINKLNVPHSVHNETSMRLFSNLVLFSILIAGGAIAAPQVIIGETTVVGKDQSSQVEFFGGRF